jgi:hypothetical protein
MPLNADFDFEKEATPSVRRAFQRGKPESKILLNPGTLLYKWTESPLVNAGHITPWWFFVHPHGFPGGGKASGFIQAEARARRLGVDHRTFDRTRAAVTQQWNSMSNLLLAELTEEVYGFAGKCLGQPTDNNIENVYFIGGEYQVWIPNLSLQFIREIPALG